MLREVSLASTELAVCCVSTLCPDNTFCHLMQPKPPLISQAFVCNCNTSSRLIVAVAKSSSLVILHRPALLCSVEVIVSWWWRVDRCTWNEISFVGPRSISQLTLTLFPVGAVLTLTVTTVSVVIAVTNILHVAVLWAPAAVAVTARTRLVVAFAVIILARRIIAG